MNTRPILLTALASLAISTPAAAQDTSVDWSGTTELVAVIDAESLRHWDNLLRGMPQHGPVAIYAMEDTSMYQQGVSSVYAVWTGSFESFSLTPVDHPAAHLDIGDLTVLVTTEAYADALVDFVHSLGGEYPEDMVLVDADYLAASVDTEYAIVSPDDQAASVFGAQALCPGFAYIEVDSEALDFVLAPPDRDSAVAVVETPANGNGWFGLELGEGWEDAASWLSNAPIYALEDEPIVGGPDDVMAGEEEQSDDPGADHRDDLEDRSTDPHEEDQVEEPTRRDRPQLKEVDPIVTLNAPRHGIAL